MTKIRGTVGGRVPDRWTHFEPHTGYFALPQLKFLGILPCKTFLDQSFYEKHNTLSYPQWTVDCLNAFDRVGNEFIDRTFDRKVPRVDYYCEQVGSQVEHGVTVPREARATAPGAAGTTAPGEAGITAPGEAGITAPGESAAYIGVFPITPPNKHIGAIINLCRTERHYYPSDVMANGIEYYAASIDGGGSRPSLSLVLQLLELFEYLSRKHSGKLVVLHCTHGINRTGFLSVALLCHYANLTVGEAVSVFERTRGYPINRIELIAYFRDCILPYLRSSSRPIISSDNSSDARNDEERCFWIGPINPWLNSGTIYTAFLLGFIRANNNERLGVIDIYKYKGGYVVKFIDKAHMFRVFNLINIDGNLDYDISQYFNRKSLMPRNINGHDLKLYVKLLEDVHVDR